jgi:hypothetical protein
VGRVHAKVSRSAAASAEGRNLVHINPDAIDGDFLVPGHDFVRPEITCLRVVPVGEDSVARPYSANVFASIGILQEDVILVSAGVGIIAGYESARFSAGQAQGNLRIRGILGVWNVDSRVYNWNIMTATAVQLI